MYLPSASPPVTVFSIVHANLLFLAPSDDDSDPLLVLEFLHRVIDVLEEFIGAPLLSSKLQANYDVVAQLLTEMCDAGIVSSTEPNALQEVVEVPGWMGKLLGGVGLPGYIYLRSLWVMRIFVVNRRYFKDIIAISRPVKPSEAVISNRRSCQCRSTGARDPMETTGRPTHV